MDSLGRMFPKMNNNHVEVKVVYSSRPRHKHVEVKVVCSSKQPCPPDLALSPLAPNFSESFFSHLRTAGAGGTSSGLHRWHVLQEAWHCVQHSRDTVCDHHYVTTTATAVLPPLSFLVVTRVRIAFPRRHLLHRGLCEA